MGIIADSLTLYKREMIIFKANLRTNVMRSVIFPLVIIVFFGNVGTYFKNTPVAVVNYANNPQSRTFINDLQINNYVQIAALTDQNTALYLLSTGNVQMVIIILPTYPTPNQPGIQVYYSNTQFTVVSALLPIINSTAAKASGFVQQPLGAKVGVVSSAIYASKGSYKDFLTAGLIPMVVVFGALFGGGMSLISDRQLGNLKAFFITPINKNAIILSRIISGATQSMVFALLALLVGVLLGAHVAMGIPGVVLLVIIASAVSIGFSAIAIILASNIARVDAYAIISQAVGLPLWFISGGITPTASLPSWLVPASVIDPLTYASRMSRDIMMQGSVSLTAAAIDFSVIIIFGAIFVYIAMKTFKSTLE